MSVKFAHNAAEWALMIGLVFGTGAIAQAQNQEEQGPVIQIGQADEGTAAPHVELQNGRGDLALPKYWVGLGGSDIPADHVLRAHIDLPEGQGLLVIHVAPESPAAKAGVKQHDILLRANGVDLHEMRDLVSLVGAEGEKKEPIALDVLRHGKHESVSVTPEERPADLARSQVGGDDAMGEGFGILGQDGLPKELLQQFRGRMPMEFRNFGPGVIVGGGQGAGIPEGVSINISKNEGQPTHITVKRGDETWEVSGDDAESLKKLPEDLRPAVEQMLHGASPMNLHMGGAPNSGDGRLRDRLERMERQLQEMSKRLSEEQSSSESK